jgi:beta-glucosidase/6-phospho-beta-glucosidase/beta-galactosidase
LLNWIKKKYNNVPVFVTENGFPDGGDIVDIGRIKYIVVSSTATCHTGVLVVMIVLAQVSVLCSGFS